MIHDVRFVWDLVDGFQWVGHLVDLGNPLDSHQTYCSKLLSNLTDKKITKGIIERPNHSVCVDCIQKNKELLGTNPGNDGNSQPGK